MAGLLAACFIFSSQSQAGGVALGATRIVYPSDSKQVSLPVTNSDGQNFFLINSWIEDEKGTKSTHFVITPPLFVIKSGKENTLRIIHSGPALPQDRETLYWLNVKAIPAVDKDKKNGNTLQLAITSRIKLFYRPGGLAQGADSAVDSITLNRQGNELIFKNPTPYYISLVNLRAGTRMLPNTTLAPLQSTSLTLPAGAGNEIGYRNINDYGSVSAEKTLTL
ncbi:fimbrial chaperone protein [Enterobacillus tribolii]|uniref:Fimbrial chaperone protein n=2 Tax=Enterobacillus tribolii TaxID=1487935 RepID=A0A370R1M4_9GAMM|nr:fimbrial chaperone protein [Enterobacillus tribolii]